MTEEREDETTPHLGRESIVRVGLPILLLKCFLLCFVLMSQALLPDALFQRKIYRTNFHWPVAEKPDTETRFKTWDGQHYLYLSQNGYEEGIQSNAFYPLWPLSIKVGSYAFFGNHLASGLFLANLFSLLALIILHGIVKASSGGETANAFTPLMLAFPGSIFLLFPYTESLFFLLCALFFFFIKRRQFGLAGLVGFLLPLSRAVGIFIALPLAYELWQRRRNGSRAGSRPPSLLKDMFLVGLPALGWGTYFLIMWLSTGDAFSGFSAQDAWIAKRSVANILNPMLLWTNLTDVGSIHGLLDSGIDRLWFVLLTFCLYRIWKMDKSYFLFCLGMGLVPAMTGSFLSYTRFFIIVFPVFLVLAELLRGEKRRGLRWTVVAMMFSVQVLFLIRHTNNFWVG